MRPVHYVAHGTTLAFDCFQAEMGRHLGSMYAVTPEPKPGQWSAPKERYTIEPPKKHTDLNRVTCLACWRQIRTMADKTLAKEKP